LSPCGFEAGLSPGVIGSLSVNSGVLSSPSLVGEAHGLAVIGDSSGNTVVGLAIREGGGVLLGESDLWDFGRLTLSPWGLGSGVSPDVGGLLSLNTSVLSGPSFVGESHGFGVISDSTSDTVIGLPIRKSILLNETSAVACRLLSEIWEIGIPSLLVIKWLLEVGTSVWVSIGSPLFLGVSGFTAFPIAVTIGGEFDGRGGSDKKS
jgi:hypothetical protein